MALALGAPPSTRRSRARAGVRRRRASSRAPDWPHAMAGATLQRFGDELARRLSARRCSASSRCRCRAATKAARRSRRCATQLFARGDAGTRDTRGGPAASCGQTDLRDDVQRNRRSPRSSSPGQRDALAPPRRGRMARGTRCPAARHVDIAGAAHAPFLSHRAAFVGGARGFLSMRAEPRFPAPDPREVDRAWCGARSGAPRHATTPPPRCSARWARACSSGSITCSIAPAAILDAGCGTGEATGELAARYPDARVVALDLALPMLVAARERGAARALAAAPAACRPRGRRHGAAVRVRRSQRAAALAASRSTSSGATSRCSG